ncbi:hypothetical protein HWV62_22281 [Athelia sp. TMB]|nr:hypothetical protein HWV62_22281 [Athelia sp. TMB]
MSKSKSKKNKHTKNKKISGRRGPPGWVTVPMRAHLESEVPAFRDAQASGKLAEFWPNMHTRFAGVFPIAPLTPQEIADGVKMEDKLREELSKLKIWFNNNGRPGANGGDKLLLDLQPKTKKPSKRLSLLQAYSKRYWHKKLKVVVDERYAKHLELMEASLAPKIAPLDFRNKVIREYWEDEPDKVKAEIAEYREHRFLHGGSSDEESDDEADEDDIEHGRGGSELESDKESEEDSIRQARQKGKAKLPLDPVVEKAKEYNQAQNAAQRAIAPILKELHARTGYVGALVLAAPDGARGGDMSTVSMFIGKTPLQLDWGQHYTADLWMENVERPLIEFATLVYPPEAREPFRLPGTSLHVTATDNGARINSICNVSRAPTTVSSGPSHRAPLRASRLPSSTPSASSSGRRANKTNEEALTELDTEDEGEPWSRHGDLLLTVQQRREIKAEKSWYERNKAYTIIRNKRELARLGLTEMVDDIRSSNSQPPATPRSITPQLQAREVTAMHSPRAQTSPSSAELALTTPEKLLIPSATSPQTFHLITPRLQNPPANISFSPSSPRIPAFTQFNLELASPKVSDAGTVNAGAGSDAAQRASLEPSQESLADSHTTANAWPRWMKAIVPAMEKVAPSCAAVNGAMKAWVEFEDLMDYPESKAQKNILSKDNRPVEVDRWIKDHRKPHAMPDVTANVTSFSKAWRAWWAGLLPIEHNTEHNNASRDLSDYAEVQKAGPNGVFLLVLSLVWWGGAVRDQGEGSIQDWRAAVADLTDVIKFFNDSMKQSRKRPLDEAKNNSTPPPPK